jgi:steroid delta-isomerase-like uncharacterized protein
MSILPVFGCPDKVLSIFSPMELIAEKQYKQLVTMYLAAFPDLHLTIEDQIAEGDKVVIRWTAHGTHKGNFMGIPPTGKEAVVTGITIDRFANGKTVEAWNNSDDLGLLQQLGVVPAPGQAS